MLKLYRYLENKKAAGICAGLADRYNFDVTLVRLTVIFVTVLTQFAPGIITYLVGWYLIPVKDKQADVSVD